MKKGDLALSTSAIVALIVALVVLGLIVVFVVRGFGSTNDLLSREAANIPQPAQPTTTQLITVSALPRATIGGQLSAKVGVLNVCDTEITTTPRINCKDPGNGDVIVLAPRAMMHTLAPGARTTMVVLADINAQTAQGLSLCVAELDFVSPDCSSLSTARATTSVEFVE